jgi:hypothetical protein
VGRTVEREHGRSGAARQHRTARLELAARRRAGGRHARVTAGGGRHKTAWHIGRAPPARLSYDARHPRPLPVLSAGGAAACAMPIFIPVRLTTAAHVLAPARALPASLARCPPAAAL